jgi:hypothetical protein
MATDKEKKDILINFINRNAFNPVLRSSGEDFKTAKKKKKLQEVQRTMANEKERFDRFKSARAVKKNYLRVLNSEATKQKKKEFSDLNLPGLPDLKEEFLKLCNKLNV